MLGISFRRILVVMLLCLVSAVAVAKPGKFTWDEVTEQDWAVAEDTASGIHDAVMIFEKIVADDEKLQKDECYRTIYRRIRILSDKGRDWADVEVPYLAFDQKIEEVQARTIRRDGTVSILQPDQIFEKRVVKFESEKFDQTSFSIPGVTGDCIIEYYVRYKLSSGYPRWIVQKGIALKHAELRWVLAKLEFTQDFIDYLSELEPWQDRTTPNYICLNVFSAPRVTSLPPNEDTRELLFEIDNLPPYVGEPATVPDNSLKTKLICYYGSKAPWSAFWGGWSRQIAGNLQTFCEKDEQVKGIVAQFAGLPTNEEKTAAAYRWLQENIRNLTYVDLTETDSKGNKKKLTPRDNLCADDVIKHGYGNRTDINRVFCDMLQEMNIDSKMCWVEDRFDDIFVKEAKYWQLNQSMVAVVTSPGQYRFYAPGHMFTPPQLIPWFVEGVDILLAGADNYFVKAPFTLSSANTSETVFSYRIGGDLKMEGRMHASVTGQEARRLRVLVVDEEENDLDDLLKDELADIVPDAELDSISWKNLADGYQPLELGCTLRYPPLTVQANRLLLKPCDYMSDMENPFYDDERKNGILFTFGQESRESAQFEIPEGWSVEAMPGDSAFSNVVGKCGIQFTNSGNIISVQRTFTLTAPFWGVQSY